MSLNRKVRVLLTTAIVACAIALGVVAVAKMDILGRRGNGLGEAFQYNLANLRKIDPASITYEEKGTFETGLANNVAVAADGETVYVAGGRRLRSFVVGKPVDEFALEGEAHALAVTGGHAYVALADRVCEAQLNGGATPAWRTWDRAGGKVNFTSVAVGEREVYVADAGNRVVWRYDKAGKLLGSIGQANKDKGVPGLVVPSAHFDVAIGADGLLRVVNPGLRRVEAFTPEGDLEFSWGRESTEADGFSGCCNPSAIVALGDGRLVTAEKGQLAMVKIFKADGHGSGGVLDAIVAGPDKFRELGESASTLAPDLAVDSRGRVLVLDPALKQVRVFVSKTVAGQAASGRASGPQEVAK